MPSPKTSFRDALTPQLDAACTQRFQHLLPNSTYAHNDQLCQLYERLARLTGLDQVLPMNTGAEAVETALKAARKWGHDIKGIPDGKAEIIACSSNFHGRTVTIISMSTDEDYRAGFGPFTPGFRVVPYGDIDALRGAINEHTAAFLVEPIQGEAGIQIPPAGYLAQAAELCRQHNVLLLADEIQTGFGRTGKMFCCEHEQVRPDIYILGKALGGGVIPVSAIAGTSDVMQVFTPGIHGSTFGGNPLGAAVAVTALDVLEQEGLAQRAHEQGEYLMDKLRQLPRTHIREIRGKGLLVGIDLEPQAGHARPFCERLMQLGVLAKETHDSVIRLAPPLVITREELDWALERVAQVLS